MNNLIPVLEVKKMSEICLCGTRVSRKTKEKYQGLCRSCWLKHQKQKNAERYIPVGGLSPNPDPATYERVGNTAFRKGRTPKDD